MSFGGSCFPARASRGLQMAAVWLVKKLNLCYLLLSTEVGLGEHVDSHPVILLKFQCRERLLLMQLVQGIN